MTLSAQIWCFVCTIYCASIMIYLVKVFREDDTAINSVILIQCVVAETKPGCKASYSIQRQNGVRREVDGSTQIAPAAQKQDC